MPSDPAAEVAFLDGGHDLEVVGESHYQDALVRIADAHGQARGRVRIDVRAVLLEESDNPYDVNAISVWVEGMKVGHLSRQDAADLRPGLLALRKRSRKSIGLPGVVVGGPELLGVWLRYDPADFGISAEAPAPSDPAAEVAFLDGGHDLEVVGESQYQDALVRIIGGHTRDRVRVDVSAVLAAEAANAISVWVEGMKVGYLSRQDAADLRPGLLALRKRSRKRIGLSGVVVGSGLREDGQGFLGVWLRYDPADFGISAEAPAPGTATPGALRTGLTNAMRTGDADGSSDLRWLQMLPDDPAEAIARLRQLLQHDRDPVDRHFMYRELEKRLYRARDTFSSALAEFDETCVRHDAEMNGIRDALLRALGAVPLLETYRQMAIRQQKAKRWRQAIWWAERGLELYGDRAARPEAVVDLQKRIATYQNRLSAETTARKAPRD